VAGASGLVAGSAGTAANAGLGAGGTAVSTVTAEAVSVATSASRSSKALFDSPGTTAPVGAAGPEVEVRVLCVGFRTLVTDRDGNCAVMPAITSLSKFRASSGAVSSTTANSVTVVSGSDAASAKSV